MRAQVFASNTTKLLKCLLDRQVAAYHDSQKQGGTRRCNSRLEFIVKQPLLRTPDVYSKPPCAALKPIIALLIIHILSVFMRSGWKPLCGMVRKSLHWHLVCK